MRINWPDIMEIAPVKAHQVPALLYAVAEELAAMARREFLGLGWYVMWVDAYELETDRIVVFEAPGWVLYAEHSSETLRFELQGANVKQGRQYLTAAASTVLTNGRWRQGV